MVLRENPGNDHCPQSNYFICFYYVFFNLIVCLLCELCKLWVLTVKLVRLYCFCLYFPESPYEEFKSLFDVNVIASCNCIKHVVRLMREQNVKGGHIFVINR